VPDVVSPEVVASVAGPVLETEVVGVVVVDVVSGVPVVPGVPVVGVTGSVVEPTEVLASPVLVSLVVVVVVGSPHALSHTQHPARPRIRAPRRIVHRSLCI